LEKRIIESFLAKEKEKEVEREKERMEEKAAAAAHIASMQAEHKKQLEEEFKKSAAKEAEIETKALKEKEHARAMEEKFKEQLEHFQRTVAMDVVMGNIALLVLLFSLGFTDYKLNDSLYASQVSPGSLQSKSLVTPAVLFVPPVPVALSVVENCEKGIPGFTCFCGYLWLLVLGPFPSPDRQQVVKKVKSTEDDHQNIFRTDQTGFDVISPFRKNRAVITPALQSDVFTEQSHYERAYPAELPMEPNVDYCADGCGVSLSSCSSVDCDACFILDDVFVKDAAFKEKARFRYQ
jgi:hypothetical protein